MVFPCSGDDVKSSRYRRRMANEQPLACSKCGQTTLHRSVDNVMTCNVCFPPISQKRENLHTAIALIFAALVVGLFVAILTSGN